MVTNFDRIFSSTVVFHFKHSPSNLLDPIGIKNYEIFHTSSKCHYFLHIFVHENRYLNHTLHD